MPQQTGQLSELGRDGAASVSPPPCGEGSGVGVAQWGNALPCRTTPHPNPPPQGGRQAKPASVRIALGVRALGLLGVLVMGTSLAGCGRCGDFWPWSQSQI